MCQLSGISSTPASTPPVTGNPGAGASAPQVESTLQSLPKAGAVNPTPVQQREVKQGAAEGPGVLAELRQKSGASSSGEAVVVDLPATPKPTQQELLAASLEGVQRGPALAPERTRAEAFASRAAADNLKLGHTQLAPVARPRRELALADLGSQGREDFSAKRLKPVADKMVALLRELRKLEKPQGRFSRLFSRGNEALKEARKTALKAELTELSGDVGKLLGLRVRDAGRSAETRFILGNGTMENALLDVLTEANPELDRLVNPDDRLTGTSFDANTLAVSVKSAAQSKFGIHFSADPGSTDLMVDGEQFVRGQTPVGEGGYGVAWTYSNEAGSRTFVVKIPKQTASSEVLDALSELGMQFDAGAHPNVLGLQGIVMTPEGFPMAVMEFATHGSAERLTSAGGLKHGLMDRALNAGLVTPRVAHLLKLQVLHDSLQGLGHLQEHCGMIHSDFKEGNLFIDGAGRMKVADFGSATFDEVSMAGTTVPYLSPELATGPERSGPKVKKLDNWAVGIFALKLFKGVHPFSGKSAWMYGANMENWIQQAELAAREAAAPALARIAGDASLSPELKEQRSNEILAQHISEHRAILDDQIAFEAIMRDPKLDTPEKKEAELRKKLPNIRLADNWREAGFLPGVSSLDKLLNSLLHPDPAQRPLMSEAAKLSLFDELGAPVEGGDRENSAELRELLVNLINLDKQGLVPELKVENLHGEHAESRRAELAADKAAVKTAPEPELSPEEELSRKRERKELEEELLARAAKRTVASTTADAERHEARHVQAERTAARVKHAEMRVLQAQRQIEAARLGASSSARNGVLARISVDTRNAIVGVVANLDPEGLANFRQSMSKPREAILLEMLEIKTSWLKAVPQDRIQEFEEKWEDLILDTVIQLGMEEEILAKHKAGAPKAELETLRSSAGEALRAVLAQTDELLGMVVSEKVKAGISAEWEQRVGLLKSTLTS